MDDRHTMEERLWNYIDGSCSAAEQDTVQQLIATSDTWRSAYQSLLQLHQLLPGSLETDEPSLRFTQNVMEAIAQQHIAPAARNYIDKRIIYGIAIFFLALIGGFIVYAFSQVSWSGPGATGNWWNNLGTIQFNWSQLFNNTWMNIFLMINTVLGLVLLDMYLGKKKKKMGKPSY